MNYSDLVDTGGRHPVTGDVILIPKDWRKQPKTYLDRHGVIGVSTRQLDSIDALRSAIRIGEVPVDADMVYYSGISLPNDLDTVTVAAWTGTGWVVRADGSVGPSSYKWIVQDGGTIQRF